MKNKLLLLSLILIMCIGLSACSKKSGSTINEPDITVNYLTTEYSTQLEKDGAEIIIGNISSFSGSTVTIEEYEAVTEGEDFYFANKNIKTAFDLDEEARIVYKTAQKPDGEILTSKNFGPKLVDNSANMYSFYIIDKKIELIVPYDLKEVDKK